MSFFDIWGACIVLVLGVGLSIVLIMLLLHFTFSTKWIKAKNNKPSKLT